MQSSLTILLGILTLLCVSLQRTYARIPLKELKRRARDDNPLAAAILKVVGYGHSLRAVLWFLIGLSSAGFFVMIARNEPLWFALTASSIVVWIGFVLIPAARVSFVSERLAAWCAPVLAKLLSYIHPYLNRLLNYIRRHLPLQVHTGMYDKHDLIALMEQQQAQSDSRIELSELTIAKNALTFGDHRVMDHMTPRRVIKAVSADEPLGPIIMDELHASGHSRFPVYEGKQDTIVGTLFLRDLVHTHKSGTVRTLMKKGVSYVHEDQSLDDALQAILKTHHQLFIVVNSLEEYVGIITIEDVLEQIVGSPIIDEFDQYDDLRAVAARDARKEHIEHKIKNEEVIESETPEQEQEAEPDIEAPEADEQAAEEPIKSTVKEEDIDDTVEL